MDLFRDESDTMEKQPVTSWTFGGNCEQLVSYKLTHIHRGVSALENKFWLHQLAFL